jgi:hypothetical protein
MQFKHPELLYALFLLLIPIIVHLFQLRKFQKEAFTNVAFLKEVTLQTRKSSQIKKWLTLLTRLGLIAAIILAFAQPYTSKNSTFNTENETVIYLDNSFSMQAKGDKGPLLKRAIQDIIGSVPEDETFSLVTNDNVYRNTTIKAITNDLLEMDYATNQLNYDAALLKSKAYFSKNASSIKNLVFISDFQIKEALLKITPDSSIQTNLVQLKPVSANNIAIDSLYISKRTPNNLELSVQLRNNGSALDNLPVSLYNNDNLLAKTSVSITETETTTFTLPTNTIINGVLKIEDTNLQFDNSFYFNINETPKINVLSINEGNDTFLKRIYTEDEFNYTSVNFSALNYNTITDQNLIVLNELERIPNALNTALKAFTNNGGIIIIIPSQGIDIQNYNTSLLNFNFTPFKTLNTSEKRLTNINYSHPIYTSVFEKRVNNFQYPKVNSFYPQDLSGASALLQFEDNKPFLSQNGNTFLFTAPLNKKNSNFKAVNLIVPTFYNIGKSSLKNADLYYTVGNNNNYDVAIVLQQDEILTLSNGEDNIIPQQHYFNNKVAVTTNETPNKAATYAIKSKTAIIENVSYNYNRTESDLNYHALSNIENITLSNSIPELFNTIKSDSKINALWKWFIIFALLLLIIEMLILKYFK